MESLGLYLSVPFCKAKCSFCNFASDAFAPGRMNGYVQRLIAEMKDARARAGMHGVAMPELVDTVYFGGGTPSLLPAELIDRLFAAMRSQWMMDADAEITIEAAPGQIEDDALEAYLKNDANRFSLGVQSFIDAESMAVGRLHTRTQCLAEFDRLRGAGVKNLGFDLICGLPHQTRASWRETLQVAAQTGVEHISVYMLEVDDGSRLGGEVLRKGARYGATKLPEENEVAEMYLEACELLEIVGFKQYEISNFSRDGFQSRHNRKYWERAPYLGLGLDAHSMLKRSDSALRFANTDEFNAYMNGAALAEERRLFPDDVWEETIFLGLRLLEGVSVPELRKNFAAERVDDFVLRSGELAASGLMNVGDDRVKLTAQGRLVSSSVFGELLAVGV